MPKECPVSDPIEQAESMSDDPRVGERQPSAGLSRREFLGITAAGSTIALAGPLGCAPAETGSTGRGFNIPESELDEVTVADLQEAMESGRWSAARISEMYLSRIEAVDRSGPTLRSVIETNPDALSIARELDDERARGNVRGPLHGIPVLIKDNIGTADRMNTTAGSYALEGAVPAEDSFVARRLREAGAIILGKANLSEWANFRSTRSSSGWSGRGGQCKNPYVLDRNPDGSSSGPGAAAAANLAALAIGTETNGSIVNPSSANGLVGIKPTVGLWSRSRIIPISHSQDTAGPMTRTVRDGAVLLGALTGVDPSDPATSASRGNAQSDYTQFLDRDGLRGARVGVARQYFGRHERIDALMEDAIAALAEAGAMVVDPVELTTRDELRQHTRDILLYEFKADMKAYLDDLGPATTMRSLADLIDFNNQNRDRELQYFGQEVFEQSEEKGPLTDREYQDALANAHRLSRDEGIDAVMNEHQLDAIIAPAGGPAWMIDLINGDHYQGGSSTFAAVSGYPNVTLPMGTVFRLPVGMSIFGRAWSEPTLLRIAYGFEQVTQHRQPPTFLPTLEL